MALVGVLAACTSGSASTPGTASLDTGGAAISSTGTDPAVTVPDPAGGTGTDGAAPTASDPVVPSLTETSTTPTTPTIPPKPAAKVTASPAFGSKSISPSKGLQIKVADGTITDLVLTNPDGKEIEGSLNDAKTVWKLGETLGYNKTYTATGTAVNSEGLQTPISGKFTTVDPGTTVRTTITPGDDAVVGVATPVVVSFGVEPADRAAIEKSVSITTSPEVEGAWGWIQHDGGLWALDWRPKDYWPANTEVHVEVKVYGKDFGGGNWGGDDLTSDFKIGRNQVVKADVNSHELQVYRDGKLFAQYDASYGRGTDYDTTTRSGIHVVTDMFKDKLMSNPKYGYTNVLEHYAVRISNNGEFIHANPGTVDSQGNTNVSHGCVNLSLEHAKEFMESSLYGDPVEVTGTDVPLSASDGDVYDWTYSWDQWQTFSALD
ncbi:L,D-transpeptidase [Nakamurella silvestris]|nr:L,D-transpeptidase [Nakamurella silvestris]